MRFPLLAILAITFPVLAGVASAASVGFQMVSIPDGAGPPIEAGIWYPTDAATQPTRIELFMQDVAPGAPVKGAPLPLVVMSHGTGGSFASHIDTAYALASQGFIAAALTHTGDNYRDQSKAVAIADRPRQLKVLIDYMTRDWPAHAADPGRIGAFGFSAGGFTVLAAAGGNPDLSLIRRHCEAHPDFFDCRLVARHGGAPLVPAAPAQVISHDARIRALVVAAPALGFTFAGNGLGSVTLPVQLWRAAADQILPQPFYAEAVLKTLPRTPEYHVVEHAGHFDFLTPCSPALEKVAAAICGSEPGFDRAAFHESFNAAVVKFFRGALS